MQKSLFENSEEADKPYPRARRIEKRAFFLGLALLGLVLSSGCVRYQYRIVEPAQFAQTVGRPEIRMPYEPLEYRVSDIEGRLGIGIFNPTDKPITLVSDKSYLVDPRQESRPLRGGVIAPHSFIDMALPPSPLVYRSEPSFSFGFGFGHSFYGRRSRSGFGSHYGLGLHHYPFHHPYYDPFYDPFYDRPTYYSVTTPLHWEWRTGEVRMRLFYEDAANTNTFEHLFTVERQRVK